MLISHRNIILKRVFAYCSKDPNIFFSQSVIIKQITSVSLKYNLYLLVDSRIYIYMYRRREKNTKLNHFIVFYAMPCEICPGTGKHYMFRQPRLTYFIVLNN